MQYQEDKIIADKLSTLDGLPPGFIPNLESKWTLLEAALHEGGGKKVRNPYWIGLAAVLITFILSGIGFYMRTTEMPASSSLNMNIASPFVEEKPSTTPSMASAERIQKKEPVEIVVKEISSQFNPLEHSTSNKGEMPVSVGSPSPMQAGVPVETQSIPDLVEIEIDRTREMKSRRRYVQIDFEDTDTPQEFPPVGKSLAMNFRLPMMRNNTDSEHRESGKNATSTLITVGL